MPMDLIMLNILPGLNKDNVAWVILFITGPSKQGLIYI